MTDAPPSQLFDVLVLLAAAVVAVPLFHRLRIGSVLGYLVAGTVVGPHALGLIASIEDIRHLAEYGVVFLLFAIGLELKLSRLLAMKRLVFGMGSLQVVLTAAVLAVLVRLSGVDWPVAVVVAGGLALSSTAVVLQILTERGELTSRAGRAAFAILLMQDLAVVPLLMLVTAVGGEPGESTPMLMARAVLRALLVGAVIVMVGRLAVRPLLRLAAGTRSSEVFAAAAVLVVLGTGWLTQKAGLSMGLGAFMAGLLLAETEYRHQVEADIQPFRGFLLGLFFITVGMTLNLRLLVADFWLIMLLLAALMALKAVIVGGLALAFGLGRDVAAHAGLMLAQGGEFAFVVFAGATARGILDPAVVETLTLAVTASMFATPALAALATRVARRLRHRDTADFGQLGETAGLHGHIIIGGFGRVGQTVARLLDRCHVPYVALDLSTERVLSARAQGFAVYFGDATREEVLRAAGAAKARAMVLTLDRVGASERAAATAANHFPDLLVYARARDHGHGDTLRRAGVTMAVPETVEASLQLGTTVLRAVGTPADDIQRLIDQTRHDNYAGLGSGADTT